MVSWELFHNALRMDWSQVSWSLSVWKTRLLHACQRSSGPKDFKCFSNYLSTNQKCCLGRKDLDKSFYEVPALWLCTSQIKEDSLCAILFPVVNWMDIITIFVLAITMRDKIILISHEHWGTDARFDIPGPRGKEAGSIFYTVYSVATYYTRTKQQCLNIG